MNALLKLLVCVALPASVSSLECYVCDHCKDPFSTQGVNISQCELACVKITGYSDDILGFVSRSCYEHVAYFTAVEEGTCQEKVFLGETGLICRCSGTLCNHGNQQLSRSATLLTVLGVCLTLVI